MLGSIRSISTRSRGCGCVVLQNLLNHNWSYLPTTTTTRATALPPITISAPSRRSSCSRAAPQQSSSNQHLGKRTISSASRNSSTSRLVICSKQRQSSRLRGLRLGSTSRLSQRRFTFDDVLASLSSINTVVFDKNGTLVDHSETLRHWAVVIGAKCEEYCGEEGVKSLFEALKLDRDTMEMSGEGMLVMRPWNEVYDTVSYELSRATGMKYAEACSVVAKWRGEVEHTFGQVPRMDVAALFATLKQAGVKVALSTSDDRAFTEKFLESCDALQFVDAIVTGTDAVAPKPQSANMRYLLAQLQTLPSNTMVVGDTSSDMLFAQNSEAALGVAVLGGYGNPDQVVNYTSLFVKSAEDIGALLSNRQDPKKYFVEELLNADVDESGIPSTTISQQQLQQQQQQQQQQQRQQSSGVLV